MTNRQYRILCILSSRPRYGFTAQDLFGQLYKRSKQPMKKVAGIYRSLSYMGDVGWLFPHGGATAYIYSEVRWELTVRGALVLSWEAQRRESRPRRPTYPRLAKAGAPC